MSVGIQAIVVALLMGLVGLASGNAIVQIAAFALLLVAAVMLLYRRVTTSNISVTRSAPPAIIAWGGALQEGLRIYNPSPLRLPVLKLTDNSTLPGHPRGFVTTLAGRKDIVQGFEMECYERGRWRIGPVDIEMADPLGFFPVYRRVEELSSVLVLPRWFPLGRSALHLGGSTFGDARGWQRSEMPPAVASIREYQFGDALAVINWRASARAQKLVSKLFEPEVESTLWLVLDLDGDIANDMEETLVTAATSLGLYALRQEGLQVGLLASGDTLTRLRPSRGDVQARKLLEIMADAHTGTGYSLPDAVIAMEYQFGAEQTVVLLTTRDAEHWQPLLARLSGKGIAVRVVQCSATQKSDWKMPFVYLDPAWADPQYGQEFQATLEGDTHGRGVAQPNQNRAATKVL